MPRPGNTDPLAALLVERVRATDGQISAKRTPTHSEGAAYLKALAEARVFTQISQGTYDRQYAATDLFDLLVDYEAMVLGRG